MGYLLNLLADVLWIDFVERMSNGKPWWVWALLAVLPFVVIIVLLGLLWFAFRQARDRRNLMDHPEPFRAFDRCNAPESRLARCGTESSLTATAPKTAV